MGCIAKHGFTSLQRWKHLMTIWYQNLFPEPFTNEMQLEIGITMDMHKMWHTEI
jgi:hypothetical protein